MSFLVNPYLYSTGCADADAVAFLAAAGITDATITSAICTLVTSMKADGTWAKMSAIYPMVGNTASQQKWNLKDPRDLNAAFRLNFVGGWTHSANGALPNGINAYADSFLTPTTTLSLNSHSYGIYSRTNDVTGVKLYGNYLVPSAVFLHHNITGANFNSGVIANAISYTANPTTGLIMASRTSNTLFTAYRAGVSLGTNTIAVVSIPNISFYFAARNASGTAQTFTNHQIAFAFLGSGLNSTEAAALYTAVQAFNTTLSRQV
jgi:hypothetical protein